MVGSSCQYPLPLAFLSRGVVYDEFILGFRVANEVNMLQAVRDLYSRISQANKRKLVAVLVMAVAAILGVEELSSADAGLIETLIIDNLERWFEGGERVRWNGFSSSPSSYWWSY